METLRYPYKPRRWSILLAGLFFAGCGVFAWKDAVGNDRGLVIDGVIHLGVGAATAFYWVIVAVCVAFALVALVSVLRSFGPTREVTLRPDAVEAPRTGWSQHSIVVPYASITAVEEQQVRSHRFLILRHTHGKLTIAGSMLPAKDDLDAIAAQIDLRRRSTQRRS